MNALPHIDGLKMMAGLQSSSANLVLTRTANGNWSYQRTATGAETYYLRATIGEILRTGETYNLALFGTGATYAPSAPAKGIELLNVFAIMNIGVVSLTSATLRVGKSVYPVNGAAAAALVQTDLLAATALPTLTTTGAGLWLTQQIAVPVPAFSADDVGLVEMELSIVMANTGTVAVAGLGAHCAFNYS
jgi:hypothetical protein